jgi:hypothetical protein
LITFHDATPVIDHTVFGGSTSTAPPNGIERVLKLWT